MTSQPPEIPLGLYAHFPWCVRKCPYCDFNSHEMKGDAPQADYLASLLGDLQLEQSRTGRKIETVFLGGGTPSLMEPAYVAELLEAISHGQGQTPEETTIEANPGAADAANFARFRQAGVNRISIGAQSFNDGALRSLGRIHNAAEATLAFKMARDAGFTNVNIDLMHGLPGQDAAAALADLKAAIDLGPEHISWYQLTIEKNTYFHSHPPAMPHEDVLDEICHRGAALLQAAGYAQYEISAWSRKGRECRHNLNYWRFGDYLGIGAGAHGKVTLGRRVLRTRKTRAPGDYLRKKAADATLASAVPASDLPGEFLMNALRLGEGFTSELFEDRTGHGFSALDGFLDEGEKRKLLIRDDRGGLVRVKTTDLGKRFLDTLLGLF